MKSVKPMKWAAALLVLGGVALVGSGAGPPGLRFFVKLALALVAAGLALHAVARHVGPRRRRKLLATLVLLTLSLLGSLAAAEVAVRLAFGDVTTTRDDHSWFARHWRAAHPPSLNRLGFREREIPDRESDRRYRIALVGDSFTYGQGVPEADRLSEQLERALTAHGGAYEVLNFGSPGAETADEIAVLDAYVLPARPDFVLLQWFVNDVEGHDKSKRPHYLRLVPSDFLSRFLQEHSALFYLATEEWISLQIRLGLEDDYEDYMTRRFADPGSEDAVAARDDLVTFFDHAREAGIEVGAVLFPRLEVPETPAGGDRLDFLLDRTLETCASVDVVCVDLRPTLADIAPVWMLWANRLDSHPGRLANERAAAAVLRTFGDAWGAIG